MKFETCILGRFIDLGRGIFGWTESVTMQKHATWTETVEVKRMFCFQP